MGKLFNTRIVAMSQAVQDYLQNKDKDYSRFIPESYKMTPEEKRNSLFTTSQMSAYEIDAATKCIKPCFTNYESPAVSQNESDCMTNCTSKALEVLTQF